MKSKYKPITFQVQKKKKNTQGMNMTAKMDKQRERGRKFTYTRICVACKSVKFH